MAGMLRELMEVEGRLAELAGVVASSTAAMVEVIADALERELWPGCGIHTPEHWVTLRCGVSFPHARRLVAAARALTQLPQTRAAYAAGEITEDHVAAIVRAGATAVHDDQIVDLARVATVSQLTKGLSCLPRPQPDPEPRSEAAPAAEASASSARTSFGADDDGTWRMMARLGLDDGLLVERALQAARDDLFRDRHPDHESADGTPGDVSWSDALVRLAQVGLDGLDPATATAAGHRTPSHRYQVVIHWDPTTGATAGPGPEPIDDATRQHLACDAVIRPWFTTPGRPVALGRRVRVVDDALRTVIEQRDRGCVVPGCGRYRWLTIHHVVHWEHGGPTDPDNLVALCAEHHRLVHRDQLRITGDPGAGTLTITDAASRPIAHSPPVAPGAPAGQAALDLGLPPPKYQTRSGERAQWRSFAWNGPATVPATTSASDP